MKRICIVTIEYVIFEIVFKTILDVQCMSMWWRSEVRRENPLDRLQADQSGFTYQKVGETTSLEQP